MAAVTEGLNDAEELADGCGMGLEGDTERLGPLSPVSLSLVASARGRMVNVRPGLEGGGSVLAFTNKLCSRELQTLRQKTSWGLATEQT